MSKEIAQTVGGKKLGLLLTLLAAIAVTLGVWQSQKADASITGTMSVSVAPAGPVAAGTNLTYSASASTTGATQGPIKINITLPSTGVSALVVGDVTCPATNGVGGGTGAWTASVSGQTATCTSTTASSSAFASGPTGMSVLAHPNTPNTTLAAATGNIQDGSPCSVGCSVTATASNTVTISALNGSSGGSVALGNDLTLTWTVPANVTGASDPDKTDSVRVVTAADVNGCTGTCSVGSVTVATSTQGSPSLVTVVLHNTAAANLSVTLSLVNTQGTASTADDVAFTSGAATGGVFVPVLRHLVGDPTGPNGPTLVATIQDNYNNVRGSRHTICATSPDGSTGVTVPVTPSSLSIQSGGGYGGNLNAAGGPSVSAIQYPVVTIGGSAATCFSWISSGAGDQEISVTYTGAADGLPHSIDFGSAPSGAANTSLIKEWNVLESSTVTVNGVALTVPTGTVTSGASTGQYTISYPYSTSASLSLNPSTGMHGFKPIAVSDTFTGSHLTRNGGTVVAGGGTTTGIELANVPWKVSLSGCGSLASGSQLNSVTGVTWDGTDGKVDPASLPSVTVYPGYDLAHDCNASSSATLTFTGWEPGSEGSGPGNTVVETVKITFTQVIPIKQVLLAWAGQRVVLEHDWRIDPGDTQSYDSDKKAASIGANGTCPFTPTQSIEYIKGAEGPGNFVAALGAELTGNSEAIVDLQQTATNSSYHDNSQGNDFASFPQGACISRVVYESEDQGEVDVEAFPSDHFNSDGGSDTVNGGVGKVAFVIYYMKLNQVQLSLVSQVAKPTHNLSAPALDAYYYYGDYAPGNPWDASKDATGGSADWNVSKDILVRGRVTGWFTNSNPSGRARDDSNKQNVLPADRWVMPDDWANIAGGASLASAFRPSYDLMFAPNNVVGLALGLPYATSSSNGTNQVSAVATGSTGTGSGFYTPASAQPIIVTNALPFVGGVKQLIVIGTTPVYVCGVINTNTAHWITVAPKALIDAGLGSCNTATASTNTSSGLPVAPAVGTPIYINLSGVPFIGPYSLIDVPGFAGGVNPVGAAPDNNGGDLPLQTSAFRDTTQGDGFVDWWDAPMPPAETTVMLRGTGFIKQVLKEQVYYLGSPISPAIANGGTQTYPNAYYYQNIPASPWLPAVASGGGYSWDSWGNDGPNVPGCPFGLSTGCASGQGPYHFWQPVFIGDTTSFTGDSSLSGTNLKELAAIRTAYADPTISRDLVVYSDNHGEFMVTANGDFKTDLTACATNVLAGGKQCKPGDKVGVGTITAVADYPDFVKHFPIASNPVTVNWTWGGYKDVTIEKGETDQYSYVVFHAMDRDGHCSAAGDGAVLLHPVLTETDTKSLGQGTLGNGTYAGVYSHYPQPNQLELVDFLIDSGNGIILSNSGLPYPWSTTGVVPTSGTAYSATNATLINTQGVNVTASGERGNVIGVPTYSVAQETAYSTGKKTFPLSPLAASGQTDECQAWIKVSNSLLGVTNVLAIAHDDEGNIGFDKVIDFQSTMSYTLNFRWSLITWNGADNIPVADALKGGASTKNPAGNDISASVTAVYGWDQAAQQWLAFFPTGVNVPGANNLTALKDGSAYWIAITGPGSVTWTVSTNVS